MDPQVASCTERGHEKKGTEQTRERRTHGMQTAHFLENKAHALRRPGAVWPRVFLHVMGPAVLSKWPRLREALHQGLGHSANTRRRETWLLADGKISRQYLQAKTEKTPHVGVFCMDGIFYERRLFYCRGFGKSRVPRPWGQCIQYWASGRGLFHIKGAPAPTNAAAQQARPAWLVWSHGPSTAEDAPWIRMSVQTIMAFHSPPVCS
ncbi:hypothetical protein METBIDRAFT_208466 [Metschnikowia bicuspidata var. bicuspidata NRRL YB-4993]|uniref:Uncharacterized protein n=1 Tax=Metschnikowia bicuspidata var. bicuspidata NRRL YB-4993 TaxID=869754 RepID=A0A1A0H771_9ASCO|nr:hypothetical protein METBIDRAFT_208466 [Metschnikowia bicuspidata var. bicuspidata NRRL YB-4993]OBA19825.1 hypothetical protein METBIDRAFT_208466 [Metschnikowia bicuspidata var. bicuspidata NRRL YB-4993]